jgi:hypothetical protein
MDIHEETITIYSSNVNNNSIYFISILEFRGGSLSDITFSDTQIGIVNFTKSELSILEQCVSSF